VNVRAAIVAIVLAAPGCVNNYVVRDDEGDDGASTTCALDDCGQGDTVADGADFECMPCASDLECGDAWDQCVMLDLIGPQCLFACPEAGCPAGLSCRPTISVGGVESMQCSPQGGTCDATDGD